VVELQKDGTRMWCMLITVVKFTAWGSPSRYMVSSLVSELISFLYSHIFSQFGSIRSVADTRYGINQ
jgi:hypothetical protein